MQAWSILTPRNTFAEQEQVLVIPEKFKGSVGLFAFFIPSNFKVFKYELATVH